MKERTIFEKIVAQEIPCDKVFEDEKFIVIKDKFPQAPVHLLIIPKEHIEKLQDLSKEKASLLADAIHIIQELAVKFEIADGYRIVINNGSDGGQSVFHLHIHLLGGKVLGAIA